jgi:hypothetical protein
MVFFYDLVYDIFDRIIAFLVGHEEAFMKIKTMHQRAAFLSLCIACSMLLSACGLDFGGSKTKIEKAIKQTVEDYLDEVQDGTFSENEYESDYAEDQPFAELSFVQLEDANDEEDVEEDEDNEAQAGESEDESDASFIDTRRILMDAALKEMTYDIGDAKGSIDDEEGSCEVVITALDIEEIISDLKDETVDVDTFIDAMTDKKAPTIEYDVTFEMSYDDNSEEWIISDSSSFSEVMGNAFEEVYVISDVEILYATVDAYMQALANKDTEAVDGLSPSYNSAYFWPVDDPNAELLFDAFITSVSYEYLEDPEITEEFADVNCALTMVDFEAVFASTADDVEYQAQILMPYLLAFYDGSDATVAYYAYLNAFLSEVALRMQAQDAPMTTVDTYMSLEYIADSQAWKIYSVPFELFSISYFGNSDPYYYADEEAYNAAYVLAAELLYQNGSINLDTYQYYTDTYGSGAVGTNYASADVLNDIYTTEWYDSVSNSTVTSYDAADTYGIEFDIYFNSLWPGLTIYYDFYNTNGTILCKSSADTLQADQDYLYAWYEMDDYSLIPADTYRVVVYLSDSTILAEEYVTVS